MAQVELNSEAVSVKLGTAGEIKVDVAKLLGHPAVAQYIFTYGLKQILNDAHSQEKDKAKKVALAQKKLDAMLAGQVAASRETSGDPVAREMLAMATAEVKNKLKAAGKKLSDYKPDVLAEVYKKQMAANEAEYRKAAEKKLAIKVEKASEIDLKELGL